MKRDKGTTAYLRSVRSLLDVPWRERRRALEEIENHLDDSRASHVAAGAVPDEATAHAIAELGPAAAVAASFNEKTATTDNAGAVRWLPMLPPLLVFVPAAACLLYGLTWIRADGLTSGARVALRSYLLGSLVGGGLSVGAYVSIRRGAAHRASRRTAWLFSGCALLLVMTSLVR